MGNKEACKKWYKANKEKKLSYQKKRQDDMRDYISSVKLLTGCSRCGYNKCARALQFHHKNDDKESNVSALVASGASLDKVNAEIAKCELLCANCHAELHAGFLETYANG